MVFIVQMNERKFGFPLVMYHNDVWRKFVVLTELVFDNSHVPGWNRILLAVFKLPPLGVLQYQPDKTT